jgi:hypothetical protein
MAINSANDKVIYCCCNLKRQTPPFKNLITSLLTTPSFYNSHQQLSKRHLPCSTGKFLHHQILELIHQQDLAGSSVPRICSLYCCLPKIPPVSFTMTCHDHRMMTNLMSKWSNIFNSGIVCNCRLHIR